MHDFFPSKGLFSRLLTLFKVGAAAALPAAEWHVSPDGSDGNSGAGPALAFRTLAHAVGQLAPGDTLILHPGVYREALVLPVSGSPGAPVTLRAALDADGQPLEAVISGFDVIEPGADGAGDWVPHDGSVWKIALPAGWGLPLGRNLVEVDGEALRPARWPDAADPVGFDRRDMAQAGSGGVDTQSEGPLDPALAGSVPDYAHTDFYRGHYRDAALAAFTAGSWAGAHVDLCAGHNWWAKTAVVTGNSGDIMDFQYRFSDTWNPVLDTPKEGDRYALWGHLQALDSPGEFFLDLHGLNGPPRTLYLWLPDGGSPVGREVALLARETSVNFGTRSHITLEQIGVRGGAIISASGSAHLAMDGVAVEFGSVNRNHLSYGAGRAVWLIGDDHAFVNGRVGHSFRRTIEVQGQRAAVRNNVLHDAAEHLLTLSGADNGDFSRNTLFRAGNTAADIGARGSLIERNHVYHAGMRITDVATLNTWDGGDLEGTEIRYNWVHSSLAPFDASRSWWGGQGIRLDSGGSTSGCSNVLIHHNVVWGTTSESGVTVWGLLPGMLNYGDAQARVYHNTVAGKLVLGGSGSVAGNDWRRNIASGFSNSTGALDGAVVADNLLVGTTLAGNLTANPGFVSPVNRNYQLRAGSPARDAGTPISGISESATGAYLGAYNPEAPPWRPGARLRPRDIAGLTAAVETDSFGGRRVRISGLPPGRTPPETFVLRVAGRAATGMTVRHHFADHRAEALFEVDLDGLSGAAPVEAAIDGLDFRPLAAPLAVAAPALLALDRPAADAAGGSAHQLQVQAVAGAVGPRRPLAFTGLLDGDLARVAIPWVVDTAAWVGEGMASDGSDLRFLGWDGRVPLRHYVESGIGKSNTLIWLMQGAQDAADVASFEDRSVLYVAWGDAGVDGGEDAQLLRDSFPALESGNRLIHLRANRLADELPAGAAVAAWPNPGNAAFDAVQPDPAMRPVLAAESFAGLPALAFDGVDDVLDVNGAAGLGSGPCRIMVVYRNPDPGTALWQRLFSARADTDMLDYVDGLYAIVENTDGTAVANPDPRILDMNFTGAAARQNFRIAGRSLNPTQERFRGEIAELIGFDGGLTGQPRDEVLLYLRRKYDIMERPRADFPAAPVIAGLQLLVDGTPADDLRWTGEGALAFTAPPYDGAAPLPATVDLTLVLADGTQLALPGGFRYRSPFESWLADRFGEDVLADPALEAGLWGATADPDRDGLANIQEYAFGGDPLAVDPELRPRERVTGNQIQLQFLRGRAEVDYVVQASGDLVDWHAIAVNPGAVGEWVSVADPEGIDPVAAPRRFLRLLLAW
jgi:hypothetical protein